MAVPNEFAGDRQFLADTEAAAVPTIVGDLSASMLQLMHHLREVVPEANRAAVNALAGRVRNTLTASNVGVQRERSTRELTPLTRLPAAEFGAQAAIANIRINNIHNFSGTSNDAMGVVDWLSKVLSLARAHTLTFNATINLLLMCASGGAADFIEQLRDEGKALPAVVQQLEMRYGELCTPDEAKVRCNSMIRKDGEALSDFIHRLRNMARMASRLEADDEERRANTESLVEINIKRVLPSSIKLALDERTLNRTRVGLPAFTTREIEKECLDLERRRNERRQESQRVAKKQSKYANVVTQVAAATAYESSSSEDEEENETEENLDDPQVFLINEIKQERLKYERRGEPVKHQKVFKRAFKRYNEKFSKPRQPAQQYRYAQQTAQGGQAGGAPAPNAGPPDRLNDHTKRTIYDLLNLAQCQKGQCIQCGMDGHLMSRDACALRGKALTDKPCVKCGKGLHSADDCVKVYQLNARTTQEEADVVKNDN